MTIGNSLWTNSAMIVMICWSSSRCWRAIVKLQRWNGVQIHVVFVDWSLGWYRCWSSTLMMMINKSKLLSYSLFPLFSHPCQEHLTRTCLLGDGGTERNTAGILYHKKSTRWYSHLYNKVNLPFIHDKIINSQILLLAKLNQFTLVLVALLHLVHV